MAQQVEQLIRNQQVAGSNPATSSKLLKLTKASQSGAFCLLFAICRFSPFALCALKTSDMQLSLSLRAPCDGDAPVLMQTDTFRPRVPVGYFSGSLHNHRFCGVDKRSPVRIRPTPKKSDISRIYHSFLMQTDTFRPRVPVGYFFRGPCKTTGFVGWTKGRRVRIRASLCALKTSDMQLMMSFRAPCDGDAPVFGVGGRFGIGDLPINNTEFFQKRIVLRTKCSRFESGQLQKRVIYLAYITLF